MYNLISKILTAEMYDCRLYFATLTPESGFIMRFSANDGSAIEWAINAIATEWDVYEKKILLLDPCGNDYDVSNFTNIKRDIKFKRIKKNGNGSVHILLSCDIYLRILPADSIDETKWIISHGERWLIAWDRSDGIVFESVTKLPKK